MEKITEIINWPLAVKRANGKQQLAKDLLKLLIETLPEHQKELKTAFTDRNLIALQAAAHSRRHRLSPDDEPDPALILLHRLDEAPAFLTAAMAFHFHFRRGFFRIVGCNLFAFLNVSLGHFGKITGKSVSFA